MKIAKMEPERLVSGVSPPPHRSLALGQPGRKERDNGVSRRLASVERASARPAAVRVAMSRRAPDRLHAAALALNCLRLSGCL